MLRILIADDHTVVKNRVKISLNINQVSKINFCKYPLHFFRPLNLKRYILRLCIGQKKE